jgi:hypothetical protein
VAAADVRVSGRRRQTPLWTTTTTNAHLRLRPRVGGKYCASERDENAHVPTFSILAYLSEEREREMPHRGGKFL